MFFSPMNYSRADQFKQKMMRVARKQGKTKTNRCSFPYGINRHILRWWAARVSCITSKMHRIFRFHETILRSGEPGSLGLMWIWQAKKSSHSSPFFPPLGGLKQLPSARRKKKWEYSHRLHVPWEPSFPSFLRVITPCYWGFKTFIFHGFGVHGTIVYLPTCCFFWVNV